MYLVLGGTGLIGTSLVRRLCREDRVRVLARKPAGLFDSMDVDMQCGDFAYMDMGDLLEDVHEVYHLISSTIPSNGVEALLSGISKDILPTMRLLEEMVRRGIKTIYFISSGGTVYGEAGEAATERHSLEPKCAHAANKIYMEHCLSMYNRYCGLEAYILRVANPYGMDKVGKRQGIIPIFTRKIMEGTPIEIWGDGMDERDYIYVEEVIDAIMAVKAYGGSERLFNVGTGVGTSTMHIVSILGELLEKDVSMRFLPRRMCDVRKSCLDVSLIERECRWRSRISIREGIGMYLAEWRRNALP